MTDPAPDTASSEYIVCIESMTAISPFFKLWMIARHSSSEVVVTSPASEVSTPNLFALILICETDSSPEMYTALRFLFFVAIFEVSCIKIVDFPMPGSPPIKTALPTTKPLPSTLSSSEMPVRILASSSMVPLS